MCVSKIRVNGNFVPCRKCWQCVIRRQNEWIFRIKQEIKHSKNAYFMTYQYKEDYVPIMQSVLNKETGELTPSMIRGVQNITTSDHVRTLNYQDLQAYFKRLRHKHPSIRYYAVGEYGEKTSRPHYHAIVISNEDVSDRKNMFIKNLQYLWAQNEGTRNNPDYKQQGFVYRDTANHRSIRYTIKYMTKRIKDTPIGAELPKQCMSKGLGVQYVENNKQHHLHTDRRYLVEEGGYKIPIPKYYKDKIWTTNKVLKDIYNYKATEQYWQEYHDQTDYQKFVAEQIKQKRDKIQYHKKQEQRLEKNSKSDKI